MAARRPLCGDTARLPQALLQARYLGLVTS